MKGKKAVRMICDPGLMKNDLVAFLGVGQTTEDAAGLAAALALLRIPCVLFPSAWRDGFA